MLRWQQSALRRRVLALEIIADLFHGDPLNTLLGVDILDQACDLSANADSVKMPKFG